MYPLTVLEAGVRNRGACTARFWRQPSSGLWVAACWLYRLMAERGSPLAGPPSRQIRAPLLGLLLLSYLLKVLPRARRLGGSASTPAFWKDVGQPTAAAAAEASPAPPL